MKTFKILLLTCSLFTILQAKASLITTNESALDAIFSQAIFGSSPIDIRIGTTTELIAPTLLDISSDVEVAQLFNMHIGEVNEVNFYFIDTISACGGSINTGIVGCGEYPGNDFVVESAFAASGYGGELLAHELGHNLGLNHLVGNFLMNPSLNSSTILTLGEVSTIFSSSLVQTDGQYFWININPVQILANAITSVPEPSTLILFLLSFVFLLKNKKVY